MRLLVTGGSGFLGRHVLSQAAEQGHSCVALARSAAAAEVVAGRGATPLAGDLDDAAALGWVFAAARCDALVNLASLGFGHAPAIVAAAVSAGLDRAVFVSTTAVTTAVATPTKAVRLAAEDLIRSSPLAWTILRPTMIYGDPGDRNLARLLTLLGRATAAGPGAGRAAAARPGARRRAAAPAAGARGRPGGRRAGRGAAVRGGGQQLRRAGTRAADVRRAAAARGGRRRLPGPAGAAAARPGDRRDPRPTSEVSEQPKIRAEQWQRLAEDKAFSAAAAARDLGYAPRVRSQPASAPSRVARPGPAAAVSCSRRSVEDTMLPQLPRQKAHSPPCLARTCRCAARPGCCSVPTRGPRTSRDSRCAAP